MATEFLGLRTTICTVDDIDKAREWYTEAFGVKPYFDQPFYVGFTIGGYELGLQPKEPGNMKKGENIRTYWGVTDVEKTYKRLVGLGATSHEEPQNVGDDIVVATVKDPWGNLIGMIFNPHFKLG